MGNTKSVVHRHGDQARGTQDLVLTVGEPLPRFYQIGRRPGLVVETISGTDPVMCTLTDGDVIYIGSSNVVRIERGD